MTADEIRTTREAMGLSQAELAVAIGLSKKSGERLIRKVEVGDATLAPTAVAALKYLHAIHEARSMLHSGDGARYDIRQVEGALTAALPEVFFQ